MPDPDVQEDVPEFEYVDADAPADAQPPGEPPPLPENDEVPEEPEE
jgi:hypothetical protein